MAEDFYQPGDNRRTVSERSGSADSLYTASGIECAVASARPRSAEPDFLVCSNPYTSERSAAVSPYTETLRRRTAETDGAVATSRANPGEAAAIRRHRLLDEQSKDGERRVTTIKIDGKPLTAEFDRKNGKVEAARFFTADGKEALALTRDAASGKLKLDGPVGADSMKLLTKMGVKVESDGSIKGQFEVSARGALKYTDNPGAPSRVSTTYLPDGRSWKVDFGRGTAALHDAAGKESGFEGWNGKKWVSIAKRDINESMSSDGKLSAKLTFRNRDGSVAKTVEKTVGTQPGDRTNLATFTYRDGNKKTYDWNTHRCKDERTGKITGKNAYGVYTENANEWQKTNLLAAEGKIFRTNRSVVEKDKDNRITSVGEMSSGDKPGKKLDLKYDAHGDVKSVTIAGKTYTRIGAEKNPGMAYHLGRGEEEAAFKRAGAQGKLNEWKCDNDGSIKKFNIGVSEKGKILLSGVGGKQKEYDLSKPGSHFDLVAKDFEAGVREVSRSVAGPDRRPSTPPDTDLAKGLNKLVDGGLKSRKPEDVILSMTAAQRNTLIDALEQRTRGAGRAWLGNVPNLCKEAMTRLASSSNSNPIESLTPEHAAALRFALNLHPAARERR